MGFLREMLSHSSTPDRSPISDFWYGSAGRSVLSGVDVDENTAFNYSAVWAASRLLTDTISTLPRFLHRRTPNGKERATGHPTYKTFTVQPNPEQSCVNYFAQQTNFVVNWGNAYAEIVRDSLGRTIQTWAIHPSRIPDWNIKRNRVDPNVDIPEGDTGELVYFVKNNNLTTTPILKRDMFHLPGILSENGITGKGVIRHAAESIGMGLATERFGASFFGEGAAPTIVMTHPNRLGEEAADNLRKSWSQRYSGSNKTNGFLVLEEGTTIDRLTIPPDQAQFIATREFNISDIARWYNVPVHMLREMSRATFSNIEQENLHYVIISIMPWLVRWENELGRQLLPESDKETYFFKFMLQGLLRGDMAARAAFYKEMWFMGVFSINDIRELEDLNTIGPIGDQRFIQSSMIPIEMAGQKQEQKSIPLNVDALIPSLLSSIESREVIAVESVNESREQLISRIDDMAATVSGHMVPKEYFENHLSGLQSVVIKIGEKLAATDIAINAWMNKMDEKLSGRNGDNRDALLSTAQTMFRGEFGRIVRKEAKGARWAAEKPREFQSRLDTWYEKHKTTYRSTELTAAFSAMQDLGVSRNLQAFIDEQIESSYTELIEKSGEATVETLATVIDEAAAVWENEKVDRVAGFVFTGVVDVQ